MTIPCWREWKSFGYVEEWTSNGMHRIHIAQLTQLVHPLDITTITEEQLKVSHPIWLKSPPMWRSLEKESNEVVLQPKGCERWVFDCHHVLHPEYVQAKKSNLNYEMAKIHWSFALEIGVEGEGVSGGNAGLDTINTQCCSKSDDQRSKQGWTNQTRNGNSEAL
ncbi:uncharacterized protein EI90DRAFT_3019937 [Cantharellus anzutake]|uniref:uncharacterized protein n=1 Tax=Cantharellus anzutake TaxID=1750568 RepID=UPI0019033439|nr:uncharacterized protein EI90DRAFT_3019937 [Cantharellus anzutake]KAF8322945.1 hypothetical protein EI90DRAFT_3019937 [Cantharellus anzutake]